MNTATRYVATPAARAAVKGRETDVLKALGVEWSARSRHVRCPYPDHDDQHPSWRWNEDASRAHCTCTPSASIFDVVGKVMGIDFAEAKIKVAEMIGRSDLIRSRGAKNAGRGRKTTADGSATAQHLGCRLADYAEAKRLPVDFLQALGVTEVSYLGKPALKIPY
jgi:DNA primase